MPRLDRNLKRLDQLKSIQKRIDAGLCADCAKPREPCMTRMCRECRETRNRAQKPNPGKIVHCRICGGEGHYRTTCPTVVRMVPAVKCAAG